MSAATYRPGTAVDHPAVLDLLAVASPGHPRSGFEASHWLDPHFHSQDALLAIIGGLRSHETALQIQEHYSDIHGFTTHVSGLYAALGFRFAPRIRDVLDQRLFTVGRPGGDDGPFNPLLKGRVNARRITENWDDVLRVAASWLPRWIRKLVSTTKVSSRRNSL